MRCDAACASLLSAPELPAPNRWEYQCPCSWTCTASKVVCRPTTWQARDARDLEHQHSHGVNYLRYWVDEQAGKIFCLVEAPSADAAREVHRAAHGLVADEIYQVSEYS